MEREISKQESYIISVVRVFSMILILLCHLVQENSNFIITQTAQIFNVGVFVFLFISGFLYGNKEINNTKKWYLKRAIRILVPLYIFIIFLIIVNVVFLNKAIDIKYYFIYLFNMQGLLGFILGAQHLWFLTALMFCYLVTPLLNKGKKEFKDRNKIVYFIILISIHSIITIFINAKLGLYLGYLYTYIFAYYFGYEWKRIIKNKDMIILTIVMIIALVIRFMAKFIIDGSIIYDGIIVIYEQIILAFWIFIAIYFTISKFKKGSNKKSKIILYFDNLSFYIYIVHIMFMTGPIRLMGLTNSFFINSMIVLMASYISAIILNKICNFIYNKCKL